MDDKSLRSRLLQEYAGKISKCDDPVWKRVLILDKIEIASPSFNKMINNFDHIVQVLGSVENALKYLRGAV